MRSLSEPRGRALLKTWRSWRKFGWFGWCAWWVGLERVRWDRQRKERHVSDSSRARTVVPSSFQRHQSSTKKVTPNTEPYQLQFSRSTKTALLMVQVNYLFSKSYIKYSLLGPPLRPLWTCQHKFMESYILPYYALVPPWRLGSMQTPALIAMLSNWLPRFLSL